MPIVKHRLINRLGLTILLTGLLMLIFRFPTVTQAGDDLPPRSTPTPTPVSPQKDAKDDRPVGAYISLALGDLPAGSWSVVQWQDFDGNWHDVEGWRGYLDGGTKVWWVAQKDFNTGPFRWVLAAGPAGEVIGISVPFTLPGEANTVLPISISTAP